MCYFGDSTCELCHIENGALKYEIVSLLECHMYCLYDPVRSRILLHFYINVKS